MPYCLTCGSMVDEYDSAYYARNMLCIPCYSRKASEVPMISCGRCGVRIKAAESRERQGGRYCFYCHGELERISKIPACPLCGMKIESYEKSERAPDGRLCHLECRRRDRRQALRDMASRAGEPWQDKKSALDMMVGRIGALFG